MTQLGTSSCAESHVAVGFFTQILSTSPRGQIATVTSHVGVVNVEK